MYITIKLQVMLRNETREVTFYGWDREDGQVPQFWNAHPDRNTDLAVRIGRGSKVHRGQASAIWFATADEARRKGWRQQPQTVEGFEGVFIVSTHVTIRNTNNTTTIGWAERYEGTNVATQQHYYGQI